MRNTSIFCPCNFRDDFRGHSRDSKQAKIDYTFSSPENTLRHAKRSMSTDYARFMLLCN